MGILCGGVYLSHRGKRSNRISDNQAGFPRCHDRICDVNSHLAGIWRDVDKTFWIYTQLGSPGGIECALDIQIQDSLVWLSALHLRYDLGGYCALAAMAITGNHRGAVVWNPAKQSQV
jgi:hypothetical protein